MGFPMLACDASASGVQLMDWGGLDISRGQRVKMAGNGMHVHCVAAVVLVALVHIEPVE